MKIALSGLNNTDNPAPGIGVAKGLKGHELIGLSYDPNEPGNYQGIFERIFLMPYPSLGFEELSERLAYIKEETGCEMLWPNLDAELPLYIKHQEQLQTMGFATFLPTMEQFGVREKRRLAQLCEELEIKHPRTKEVHSVDELVQALGDFSYPVMIKGNYYKAKKAMNLEEAIAAFSEIANEWGYPILVQEIVEGEEINYTGVSAGTLYGGFCIKKLTTTELGKVWSAVTIKNAQMEELARRFVEHTRWRGAFELEAIAAKDGIYLIEINPRFPAWIGFSVDIGLNLPKMALQLALGKRVRKKLTYPEQKMYVRYVDELVCDFSNFTQLLTKKEL